MKRIFLLIICIISIFKAANCQAPSFQLMSAISYTNPITLGNYESVSATVKNLGISGTYDFECDLLTSSGSFISVIGKYCGITVNNNATTSISFNSGSIAASPINPNPGAGTYKINIIVSKIVSGTCPGCGTKTASCISNVAAGSFTNPVNLTVTSNCSGWSTTPSSATLSASSSSGNLFNVGVAVGTNCSFSAVSNNTWITNIAYPGGGGVNYSVTANTGAARTGSISVKDANNNTVATFTVNQNSNCSGWYVSPTSTTLSATSSSGNSFNVNVTIGSSCSFSAVSNNSWISNITYPGGGGVNYSVTANTGAARTGSISIKDGNNATVANFIVDQNTSCSAVNMPNAIPSPIVVTSPSNATINVSVTGTNPTFQWQYSTNSGSSWINVPSNSQYSGVQTSQLSISSTSVGMNGYLYRCMIGGDCTTTFGSNWVTLNVNSPTGPPINVTGNLAFGNVTINTSSVPKTLTIWNTGTSTLNVTSISYPTGYSGSWSGGSITAGGNQAVSVTFAPISAISYPGTITVNSNASSGTSTISCSGTGVNPTCNATATINVNPTSVTQGAPSPIITFTGAGGTAPYTFTYKINGGSNLTATTTSGNSKTITVPTTTAGTYTYSLVSVTDANGCAQTQSGSVVITVNTPPPSQMIFYASAYGTNFADNMPVGSSYTNISNPQAIKICADGSSATFITYYNNDPNLSTNNIGFRVKYLNNIVTNSQIYGSCGIPFTLVNPTNVRKVIFNHPDYLDVNAEYRLQTIEVYNISNGNTIYSYPIKIYRAPLLCVHGLWGNSGTFEELTSWLISSSQLFYPNTNSSNTESHLVYRMQYPNNASFSDNKNVVKMGVSKLLTTAIGNGYSCGKVDIVAHSMGGIMARLYIQNPYSNVSYLGNVHKLITVNTPHSGSQLANLFSTSCQATYPLLEFMYNGINVNCNNLSPAINDLRVDNYAIDQVLNGLSLINTNLVPTFAIVTKDNNNVDNSCKWWGLNWGILTSNVFGYAPNDDVVAVTSQQGGIAPCQSVSGVFCDYFNNICHMSSTEENVVKEEIRDRINWPTESTYYDINGYQPPNLNFILTPSMPTPTLSTNDSVQFLTPSWGTNFNSGSSLGVTANGSLNIVKMKLVIGNEFISPITFDTIGNYLQNSIIIPNNVIGDLRLIVIGEDSSQNLYSDTLRINVNSSSLLDSIQITPTLISVPVSQNTQFEILGHYSDGSIKNISHLTALQYVIADTNTAKHIKFNEIYGKSEDTTQLTINFGVVSKTVQVIVLNGDQFQKPGFLADDTTTCAGEVVNFTNYSSGNPTSLVWQFTGGTPSMSTSENPSVLYNTPGVYDVRLIATYPSKIDTLIMTGYVTVNSLPTISTSTTTSTICQGAFTNLTANGGNTYTWMPGLLSGATISVSPTSSTTYTVSGTNSNGCVSTTTKIITVNPTTTNGSTIINDCNFYLWNGVTYTASGIYTYTSLNGQGCLNLATLDLTVNNNTSSALSVTACNAYTWTTGNGATYTNSGVYTNTISLNNGCINIDSLHLTIGNLENGLWTWISGDSSNLNSIGVYGTKGISSPLNKPGGREEAACWTDSLGDFWLFGGWGNSNNNNDFLLNDLWKYSKNTQEWTWMKGSDNTNQLASYGVKGIAFPNSTPGARKGALTWYDNSGYLWLFGGEGFVGSGNAWGMLNDLWKYNINSGFWTWVSGSNLLNQPGLYGIKGISATNRTPKARRSGVRWIDDSGNLWLFGGHNGYGQLNDLWKYNKTTNQWTWISGDSIINQIGVYGNLGLPSTLSKPGARSYSIGWKDALNNLWLFGGMGYSATLDGQLNDLWKYNLTSNQWSWEGGSNYINQASTFGTKGIGSPSNIPSGRYAAAGWTDLSNNFWLLGGTANGQFLDDLWKYDPILSAWTWIGGTMMSNQMGSYGNKGVPLTTNSPGNRIWSSSSSSNIGFLLFGGMGYDINGNYGYLNDLWKYSPICSTNLDIKLFLQGCYVGSGLMAPVLKNEGVGVNSFITDSIDIELHSSTSPYQVLSSTTAILKTNGTTTCSFPFISGFYYIVTKHRNGIETWSATPVAFGEAQTIYDFSDNSIKAFGNNMSEVSTGIWAIYSGDLNLDQNIDLLDISDLEYDINVFNFGYYATDLNGDGNVDLLDASILEPNVNNFIFSNHP